MKLQSGELARAAALFLIFSFPFCRSAVPNSNFKVRQVDGGRIVLYELPKGHWPSIYSRTSLLAASDKRVFSGLDLMHSDAFALLRGRSFALLTNATGLDQNLERGLDLMIKSGLRPVLLLEPEHGLYGFEDRVLEDGMRQDKDTGMRVLSLYSKKRKPSAEDLAGIDVIVVDIHNLPVRCYTYVSTLTYILEAAEEQNIEVMILDRANPYGFWRAQGAFLEEPQRSFISYAPVPYIYSQTPGEYALYMAVTRLRKLRVSVVLAAGYERSDDASQAAYTWVNPSPNIPSFEAALAYPALVFFEAANYSVGRGTTRPFVYSGAPWLKAADVIKELRALGLPGVNIGEVTFTPSASEYRGQVCHGVQIIPVSRDFDPIQTGYEYIRIVMKLHPGYLWFRKSADRYFIDMLWGNSTFRDAVTQNIPFAQFRRTFLKDGEDFEALTKPVRLY
ncbi:MAG: DUF1343 domain-containing protein [Spirochaetia bacterium]|nr:DUF1343 domain-containing protein [Spirochaetia bacterium]